MNNIIEQKHKRADRVIHTNNLRKANTAFKEMTKFLKALRVKEQVLRQNILFMRTKRALQTWNQRVELTNMLRRKNDKVVKEWHLKVMARVFKGWKEMNREETVDMSRMNRIVEKMRHYDTAQAFQKWQ